jgi:HEAT repeat protein
LNYIIGLIDDEKVKVRSKAIKSLYTIIENDSSVKDKPFIQAAICQHLGDQSSMVRDNILDLIGKILASTNSIDKVYVRMVIGGVKDTAKSVRKRSINILGDLCLRDDIPEPMVNEICWPMILQILELLLRSN